MADEIKNVLIAGGSGLIGSRLMELLLEKGYSVSYLSRRKISKNNVQVYQWNPATGFIEADAVKNADYIVNLAGEGIADKAWTAKRKEEIISSRVNAAKTIFNALQKNSHPIKSIVCASAIGYYKKNSEEMMTEENSAGNDFLAHTVEQWEAASKQFENSGIRTVIFRTGIVLSLKDGALLEMYKPLNFFIAAYFGKGNQYYSWIHVDDLCNMFIKAMEDEKINGIYNVVAPNPETNKNFMKTLVDVKGGFSFLSSVPAFVLKIILGERASIVLDGIKVSSKKISDMGFTFQYAGLKSALKNILKKQKSTLNFS